MSQVDVKLLKKQNTIVKIPSEEEFSFATDQHENVVCIYFKVLFSYSKAKDEFILSEAQMYAFNMCNEDVVDIPMVPQSL